MQTNVGIYEAVVTAIEDSGFSESAAATWKIEKGATTFEASARSVKLKKVKIKTQKTSITVTYLTDGSAEPAYEIKSVTRKMKKQASDIFHCPPP